MTLGPERGTGPIRAGAGADALGRLTAAGVGGGDLVALTAAPGVGLGLAARGASVALGSEALPSLLATVVKEIETELHPRWVLWSRATASLLVRAGVRVGTCFDLALVHRICAGGSRDDPGRVWALAHGLDPELAPQPAAVVSAPDLFHQGDPASSVEPEPLRPDGYLAPSWVTGEALGTPDRLARAAELALRAATAQQALLGALDAGPVAITTARSESTASLLCAELEADGLPFDGGVATAILERRIGPRPVSGVDAARARAARDQLVLRHVATASPPGAGVDLRSPSQVRDLLRTLGIDLPDTRAWRLRELASVHPVVAALLEWRAAERIATTYGYGWLDRHLGSDGRLRGTWSVSDGASGRMTASAGLHNMPAELRPAVVAEPGRVFVRADLGQIEPRVLAAVSGDPALSDATAEDDLYAPVAARLGIDRAAAKLAVLGAMYGQRSGQGGAVLRQMEKAYPVAMAYLDAAYRAGWEGVDLRTHGGRLIRLSGDVATAAGVVPQSRRAAMGRYARNACIQGAAAELFKLWAVTVRARGRELAATIVLLLHDELLVQVPVEHAGRVVELVGQCLVEAAQRKFRGTPARFVSQTAVLRCWADAKLDHPA